MITLTSCLPVILISDGICNPAKTLAILSNLLRKLLIPSDDELLLFDTPLVDVDLVSCIRLLNSSITLEKLAAI